MEATITWCFSTPHPALGGPATPGGVTFPSSAHLLACSALTFKGRVPRGMYRSVCFLLTVRVCALWKGGWACVFVQHRLCWCKWEALVCSGMGDRVDR